MYVYIYIYVFLFSKVSIYVYIYIYMYNGENIISLPAPPHFNPKQIAILASLQAAASTLQSAYVQCKYLEVLVPCRVHNLQCM